MKFRDNFLSFGKTHAEWSLAKTTATGLQANEERLKALQKTVKSAFEQGIDRITLASASLQAEVTYQADRLEQAILEGSRDVVLSIQQMSDYLGSELCEVRWAVERHSKVSEGTLRILLNSLDNESRQLFEQGVKCYDASEYGLAKRTFIKALEANVTNYFAYEYLGFIAVTENEPVEALRNFDLARKFAGTNYHQALALSHLARSNYALGEITRAAELAKAALGAHPESAKFWYEFAAYSAQSSNVQHAVEALKEAIERDWTFWAVVSTDADFDSMRSTVITLLDELRERERQKTHQAIDNLKRVMQTLKRVDANYDLTAFDEICVSFERRYRAKNVFIYRHMLPEVNNWHEKAFGIIESSLISQIASRNETLADLEASVTTLKSKLQSIGTGYREWGQGLFDVQGSGCVSYGCMFVAVGLIGYFAFAFGALFFLQFTAFSFREADDLSIRAALLGGFLFGTFSLFIPTIANARKRRREVALPKQQTENELLAKEQETEPIKKRLLEELVVLNANLEKCKLRQYF